MMLPRVMVLARDGHADPNADANQMRIDAHLMRISAYNAKKI